MSGLRVTVDARPLDIGYLRTQGIGRYAHGLIGPLADVARERGGELTLLREGTGSAFGGEVPEGARVQMLRRPRVPERLVELPEQVLLRRDLREAGAQLHHSLSIYRSALWPGVPSVMTMHDVVPLMWPETYLRTGYVHHMLYAAARRARWLIAVSEAARRDILAHLDVPAERVTVVHEAADERFRPSDPDPVVRRLGLEGPYVLWVGGLGDHDPRKNLDTLIDAFGRWRTENARPETLVVAGRIGTEGERLRTRAGEGVRFAGFVPDEDLPALYSGASCFVTATRYEGFGLPALEAVACGTPVVAYDVGAVPEVAGPGAVLAPDGDEAALMRAVAQVCDDSDLRARLAADGMRHAAAFSWGRAAQETWDVYERALS